MMRSNSIARPRMIYHLVPKQAWNEAVHKRSGIYEPSTETGFLQAADDPELLPKITQEFMDDPNTGYLVLTIDTTVLQAEKLVYEPLGEPELRSPTSRRQGRSDSLVSIMSDRDFDQPRIYGSLSLSAVVAVRPHKHQSQNQSAKLPPPPKFTPPKISKHVGSASLFCMPRSPCSGPSSLPSSFSFSGSLSSSSSPTSWSLFSSSSQHSSQRSSGSSSLVADIAAAASLFPPPQTPKGRLIDLPAQQNGNELVQAYVTGAAAWVDDGDSEARSSTIERAHRAIVVFCDAVGIGSNSGGGNASVSDRGHDLTDFNYAKQFCDDLADALEGSCLVVMPDWIAFQQRQGLKRKPGVKLPGVWPATKSNDSSGISNALGEKLGVMAMTKPSSAFIRWARAHFPPPEDFPRDTRKTTIVDDCELLLQDMVLPFLTRRMYSSSSLSRVASICNAIGVFGLGFGAFHAWRASTLRLPNGSATNDAKQAGHDNTDARRDQPIFACGAVVQPRTRLMANAFGAGYAEELLGAVASPQLVVATPAGHDRKMDCRKDGPLANILSKHRFATRCECKIINAYDTFSHVHANGAETNASPTTTAGPPSAFLSSPVRYKGSGKLRTVDALNEIRWAGKILGADESRDEDVNQNCYDAMVREVAGFFDANLTLRMASQKQSPKKIRSPLGSYGSSQKHLRHDSVVSVAISEYQNLDINADGDREEHTPAVLGNRDEGMETGTTESLPSDGSEDGSAGPSNEDDDSEGPLVDIEEARL